MMKGWIDMENGIGKSLFEQFANKINDFNSKINALKEERSSLFQKEINVIFENFFKENPEVRAIRWTQYTPYFNDGDECIFGVNQPTFFVGLEKDIDYDELEELEEVVFKPGDWIYEKAKTETNDSWYLQTIEKYEKQRKGLGESCKSLARLLEENGEVMEQVFGNHVEITVVPGKDPIVEDYDHE